MRRTSMSKSSAPVDVSGGRARRLETPPRAVATYTSVRSVLRAYR
jgi:hypothetical protein